MAGRDFDSESRKSLRVVSREGYVKHKKLLLLRFIEAAKILNPGRSCLQITWCDRCRGPAVAECVVVLCAGVSYEVWWI